MVSVIKERDYKPFDNSNRGILNTDTLAVGFNDLKPFKGHELMR